MGKLVHGKLVHGDIPRDMFRQMPSIFLLIATTAVVGATTPAWEWSGIFATPNNDYVWTAQQKTHTVNGTIKQYRYADPTMTMVIIPTSEGTQAVLTSTATRNKATTAFANAATTQVGGTTLIPSDTTQYKLTFNNALDTTSFAINASNTAFVAIFCQHFPTEFERDRHYLKDLQGADVEPIAQTGLTTPAAHDDHKPWGTMIGATFLVCLCTLFGVIFALPCFEPCLQNDADSVYCLANAFAAGALLAAAFYLMLYEATHLIVFDKEAKSTAYWGSMIIAGFVTSHIIDICVSGYISEGDGERDETTKGGATNGSGSGSGSGSAEEASAESKATAGVTTELTEPTEVAAPKAEEEGANASRVRVRSSILIGDFMHNLVDGIVIGAAFLGCSSSVAWGITGATIVHEIAQEISDYFVLTDPGQGGLSPFHALSFNFISGLSVVLGGIIVLAQDEVSNKSQGALLAFGGGVYLQIAASECMPRVHLFAKSVFMRVTSLGVFFFGVFAIDIILVAHEHCVPAGAATAGGHAH